MGRQSGALGSGRWVDHLLFTILYSARTSLGIPWLGRSEEKLSHLTNQGYDTNAIVPHIGSDAPAASQHWVLAYTMVG